MNRPPPFYELSSVTCAWLGLHLVIQLTKTNNHKKNFRNSKFLFSFKMMWCVCFDTNVSFSFLKAVRIYGGDVFDDDWWY